MVTSAKLVSKEATHWNFPIRVVLANSDRFGRGHFAVVFDETGHSRISGFSTHLAGNVFPLMKWIDRKRWVGTRLRWVGSRAASPVPIVLPPGIANSEDICAIVRGQIQMSEDMIEGPIFHHHNENVVDELEIYSHRSPQYAPLASTRH